MPQKKQAAKKAAPARHRALRSVDARDREKAASELDELRELLGKIAKSPRSK